MQDRGKEDQVRNTVLAAFEANMLERAVLILSTRSTWWFLHPRLKSVARPFFPKTPTELLP